MLFYFYREVKNVSVFLKFPLAGKLDISYASLHVKNCIKIGFFLIAHSAFISEDIRSRRVDGSCRRQQVFGKHCDDNVRAVG